MLQLPIASTRFTEIANIAGRAKAQPAKPDPIFKALAKLDACRTTMTSKQKAYDAIRKRHDPKVFEAAAVFLPAPDIMMFASNNNRRFLDEGAVTEWAKKQRTHFRDHLSRVPDWDYGKRALKRLRELAPLLKSTLKTEQTNKDRYHKKIGYPPVRHAYYKAMEALGDAEWTLVCTVPTTRGGAQAMLEFVRRSLEEAEKGSPNDFFELDSFRAAKALASAMTALANLNKDSE